MTIGINFSKLNEDKELQVQHMHLSPCSTGHQDSYSLFLSILLFN